MAKKIESESDDFADIVDTRRMSVMAPKYNPGIKLEQTKYPKNDSERKKIENLLRTIYIFKTVHNMNEVVDSVRLRVVKAGEVILKEDAAADDFYIVDKGEFEVYRGESLKKVILHKYHDQGYFGELALIHNTARSATVQATTDGRLWVLDGGLFRSLVQRSAFEQRNKYEKLLGSAKVLNTLNDYEKARLSDSLSTREFVKGADILEEGGQVKELLVVAEGQVGVWRNIAGKKVLRTTLQQHDLLGLEGLVLGKPSVASAQAASDCKLVVVTEDAFKAFLVSVTPALRSHAEQFVNGLK